ncbi:hypothetical protein Tco_0827489 [Tanacetum coccineum]
MPTPTSLKRVAHRYEASLLSRLFVAVCSVCEENVCHIFFRCDLAQLVLRRIAYGGHNPHTGHRSKIGSLGFFDSVLLLRSKHFEECSSYLGGIFWNR